MRLRTIFSTILFLLPFYLSAHITGTYELNGFDPDTNQSYTGTVVIERQRAIYTATWTFDGGNTDIGTGVRKDDSISFVFLESNSNTAGVQLYEIDGHTLKGPWARFGATRRGFEKLKKVERPSS